MGPYSWRSVELKHHIAGVLTNPNCEFAANFIAMHTLASWAKATEVVELDQDSSARLEAESEGRLASKIPAESQLYNPVRALQLAMDDWLPIISTPRSAFGPLYSYQKKPQALQMQISTCAR